MPPIRHGRSLLALAALAMLAASPAPAQENLDAGKPAPKLFAEGCAACHRGARGLAKDRFTLTLYLFLQKHYASNSQSAWALASYLESVDSAKPSAKPGAKRAAAATSQAKSTNASTSLRPPASIPSR